MRLNQILITLTLTVFGAMSLPAQEQIRLTVNATMDIYRAGRYNDASDGIAPVVFTFPAGGWRTLTFPSVGGAWSCNNKFAPFGADGTTSASSGCSLTDIKQQPGLEPAWSSLSVRRTSSAN